MASLIPHPLFWIALTCLFTMGCQPIQPSPPAAPSRADLPTLELTLLNGELASRYVPLTFGITGIPEVTNPFDPAEIDLQLYFTAPDGTTITVGGFWYQAYAPGSDQPLGPGEWRARFTPIVAGEWSASALLHPSGLTSSALHFTVAESALPGFVRVDPTNPRYFAYDLGTRFFPVGINMGWWNDDPLENYTRWLDHFAANGGNTIRLWMANWAFGLEWSDTPLGDYRPRMYQAWVLDEVLRLADERGVKVILVINHHGQFSHSVNSQWHENPYDVDLGGPLSAPEQFASDPAALALFQRRLRYIVDRWGASPNLLAWEWWNEYNFTPIDDRAMEDWLVTMDAFLTSRDPYQHLVTISGPAGPESPIWRTPEIDFVSVHVYSTEDPLQLTSRLAKEYGPAVPMKPLLLAEFGFATGEETVDSHDKTGIHLHNGLWASLFSGHAGSGMYWWWDSYIEPLNLWHHFGSLANFLEDVDPAGYHSRPLPLLTDQGQLPALEGLLLEGAESRLIWVRSTQYTAAAVEEAFSAAVRSALRNRETLTSFSYTPTLVNGHSVQIEGVNPGRYLVEWYDPQSGTWGESQQIESVGELLIVALPALRHDLAARITQIP